MNKRDVAALIDHTILKPEATKADVARIVEEGAAAGTFSVCVSPSMLPLDVPEGLKVACVVGFPSGAVKPQVKAFEAAQAACSNSAFLDQYQIPGSYAPIGSFRLIDDVVRRAREADVPIHVGNILSSDTFYNANPTFNEAWQRMGVLAVEMESAGLYATAAHAGVEAVGIFTVSDSLVTGEATDAQARQTSFTTMMELALPLAQL